MKRKLIAAVMAAAMMCANAIPMAGAADQTVCRHRIYERQRSQSDGLHH